MVRFIDPDGIRELGAGYVDCGEAAPIFKEAVADHCRIEIKPYDLPLIINSTGEGIAATWHSDRGKAASAIQKAASNPGGKGKFSSDLTRIVNTCGQGLTDDAGVVDDAEAAATIEKAMAPNLVLEPPYDLAANVDPLGDGAAGTGDIDRGEAAVTVEKAVSQPERIIDEIPHDLVARVDSRGLRNRSPGDIEGGERITDIRECRPDAAENGHREHCQLYKPRAFHTLRPL